MKGGESQAVICCGVNLLNLSLKLGARYVCHRSKGQLRSSRTEPVMQYSSNPIFGGDNVQACRETVCLWWRRLDVVAVVHRPY